jgi:hypothetical protein
MHPEARAYVASVAMRIEPAVVVDLGGRNVNGGIRDLFRTTDYTAVDKAFGRGVNIVADAAIWHPKQEIDCVVCTEVLEHSPLAAAIVCNAAQMLKPGGCFIMTCAAKGRGAHSATGGRLQPGEWYHNPRFEEVEAWLEASGLEIKELMINNQHHDLYCWAVKK